LYSLSVEDATPLQHWIARGQQPAPDPDQAADMYEHATDVLAAAGYVQYEISNWAKPGHACQHNLHVWHNLPYLGFGAGAHGYAAHTRYANTPHPADYIARLMTDTVPRPFPLSAAADEVTHLTPSDVMAETVIMALRLVQDGINETAFAARFGQRPDACYGPALARLTSQGLLERTPQQHIRLTPRGRLLGNRVFAEFI
jgi:oxygen-independent coproporphyrinogen-3 oxidase